MKGLISKIVMIFGFTIFFGIILSYDFRISLALLIENIFFPFVGLKFYILVLIMSILTALYSNLIQKYTVDYERMKVVQKKISEYQKEYIDAMKQKNQYKLKQLEQKKDEMKLLQSEMMSMQFKPMSYTFIVSIPIWAWLWERAYLSYRNLKFGDPVIPGFQIKNELFIINSPFWGTIHANEFLIIFPWWLIWYFLCSVIFGQFIKKILKVGV
ncbi:MAG: EMC3/TMCO1 family protein [Archaeoglobaceae archaeon]|nr:EMC3/TMCO1 family protein [Archaeoglobaceae archaeon]MDW7989614.1 EMC3/TMCO1 family protein [Archaeoglobaceae archaeon]